MKTCLFAGTFDPVTNGHIEMIKRLLERYEKVVVAIGVNPNKTPMFSLEDRLSFLRASLTFSNKIEVDSYDALTVEYMQKKGIKVLVRGIRNQVDMSYERENEEKSKKIYPQLVTEYLTAEEGSQNISSTLVREKILKGEDFLELVPKECYQLILRAKRK